MEAVSFVHTCIDLSGKDAKIPHRLGYHVRNQIKKDPILTHEKQDVLLNYPVVYVHTWQDAKGTLNFYVGESFDLTQRTKEHQIAQGNSSNWQHAWGDAIQAGREARSFYFSSREMNKSLVKDLEYCLAKQLEKISDLQLTTDSVTRQDGYSNKHCRDTLLAAIWNVLQSAFPSLLPPYDNQLKNAGASRNDFPNTDHPVFFTAALDPNHLAQAITSTKTPEEAALLLNYPVVYLHMWSDNEKTYTYVGEANNLLVRTNQHLNDLPTGLKYINNTWIDDISWQDTKKSWQAAVKNGSAKIYVFGHKDFNKSMTLDIENRLIQYTIFLGTSVNGRTNEQHLYSNSSEMHARFSDIVNWLHTQNSDLFPTLPAVQERSVFMASPLMKLTPEQEDAKNDLMDTIHDALAQDRRTLIVVRGGAGTGKTVLAASLFFKLLTTRQEAADLQERALDCRFIVNHKELYNLYENMVEAWQLGNANKAKKLIWMAQEFLNAVQNNDAKNSLATAPDVVFVDEAHLLYTQGHMGGIKDAQLPGIIQNATVTILMYDPDQYVNSDQAKNADIRFEDYCGHVVQKNLNRQMRMKASPATKAWLESLTDVGSNIAPLCGAYDPASPIPCLKDSSGYEIYICETPQSMIEAIAARKKAGDHPSCLLATYNWSYSGKTVRIPTPNDSSREFVLPWHHTGKKTTVSSKLWTTDNTLEIGSVHDIQGFDLKYAGVVLGPSLRYNCRKKGADGKMHTMPGLWIDGQKRRGSGSADEKCRLTANEIGILLSRATNGLYIYATDPDLRQALIDAIRPKKADQ